VDETLFKRARQFVEALPHCRALNMRVESAGDGKGAMSMPYDPKLIGDPVSGVIFGGAVSVLLDTCSGVAVFAHPKFAGLMSTLDLRIDYMRAATPGQTIRAEAHCYHITRTVAFVRTTAYDDDNRLPVATAAGAFTHDVGKGIVT